MASLMNAVRPEPSLYAFAQERCNLLTNLCEAQEGTQITLIYLFDISPLQLLFQNHWLKSKFLST
jgi:hypothetical protein